MMFQQLILTTHHLTCAYFYHLNYLRQGTSALAAQLPSAFPGIPYRSLVILFLRLPAPLSILGALGSLVVRCRLSAHGKRRYTGIGCGNTGAGEEKAKGSASRCIRCIKETLAACFCMLSAV